MESMSLNPAHLVTTTVTKGVTALRGLYDTDRSITPCIGGVGITT